MAALHPLEHSRVSRAISWSIAIALIIAGIYLSSTRFMNSEWLTRAGCLIVMLGIWSSLGGIMQERLLSARMRRRLRNAKTQARARLDEQGVQADAVETELGKIDEDFEKEFSELSHDLRLSLGFLEVSLLLTGTFLWGFGDLLVR